MFDVRVFNPFAASAISFPLPQLYRRNENENRRKYEQAQLAENCSFTPLIFSTSGGASQLTKRFLQVLSAKLSEKKLGTYAEALSWLRTRFPFTIARAGSLCLRGFRVKFRNQTTDVDPVLALAGCSWTHVNCPGPLCMDFSPHVLSVNVLVYASSESTSDSTKLTSIQNDCTF